MLYVMKRKNDPIAVREIEQMKTTISEMKKEIAQKKIYMPSDFWSKWAELHEHLLEFYGLDNLKRTVSHQYQNWYMTKMNDPQVRKLIELWQTHLSPQPLFNTIEHPSDIGFYEHIHFPFYHLSDSHHIEIYKLAVSLLWEYTLINDNWGILKGLSESPLGNPIRIMRDGKLISSDLCHSVRERNNILNATGLHGNEALVVGELGAGHGRLAEIFRKTTNYRYIIFDIPPTLYVSQWYIKNLFPNEKIFEFRSFSNFSEIEEDLKSSQVAFFTPNQIEYFPDGSIDIFININSLMEMRHEQIKNFLSHITRLTRMYFFSQQWYKWKNTADNIDVNKEDFKLEGDCELIYEKSNEIYNDFFIQIWKKL